MMIRQDYVPVLLWKSLTPTLRVTMLEPNRAVSITVAYLLSITVLFIEIVLSGGQVLYILMAELTLLYMILTL